MDTITTTIKREWLEKIVARSKRIEYRQIRRSWTQRLKKSKYAIPLSAAERNEPADSRGDRAN
jgi:hypothetical protein